LRATGEGQQWPSLFHFYGFVMIEHMHDDPTIIRWANKINEAIPVHADKRLIIKKMPPKDNRWSFFQINYNDAMLIMMGKFRYSVEFTLCHEWVHLDQYQRGDTRATDDCLFWQGQAFPWTVIHSLDPQAYDNLPWEKEANERAHKMVNEMAVSRFSLNTIGKFLKRSLMGNENLERRSSP
jgi:hypothetical protein